VDRSAGFQFRQFRSPAGEPHVYVTDESGGFPAGFNTTGAKIVDVTYRGGGWSALMHELADAAQEPLLPTHHMQAFYEGLEALSQEQPFVLLVRRADRLLEDVGFALLDAIAHWEAFVRHGTGVADMYLVLEGRLGG